MLYTMVTSRHRHRVACNAYFFSEHLGTQIDFLYAVASGAPYSRGAGRGLQIRTAGDLDTVAYNSWRVKTGVEYKQQQQVSMIVYRRRMKP